MSDELKGLTREQLYEKAIEAAKRITERFDKIRESIRKKNQKQSLLEKNKFT